MGMQHPVSTKLLEHIGDITVSFAMVENQISILIGSFINEHQRIGQIITAELPFRGLRALSISFYQERHGEDADFKNLKVLMRRASELEGKRNQIIHSIWAASSRPDTITRIKTTAKESEGLNFSFQTISETDLAALAQDLRQLAEDILSFQIKLIDSGKAINNPIKKQW